MILTPLDERDENFISSLTDPGLRRVADFNAGGSEHVIQWEFAGSGICFFELLRTNLLTRKDTRIISPGNRLVLGMSETPQPEEQLGTVEEASHWTVWGNSLAPYLYQAAEAWRVPVDEIVLTLFPSHMFRLYDHVGGAIGVPMMSRVGRPMWERHEVGPFTVIFQAKRITHTSFDRRIQHIDNRVLCVN